MLQLITCLIVYLVLFLSFIPISCHNEKVELLDRNHTSILKGIAIMAVIFGHIGQYAGINGIEFPGGVGVSIFILFSGYGLAKSAKRNPIKLDFWKKRIVKLLIPYVIIRGGVLLNYSSNKRRFLCNS